MLQIDTHLWRGARPKSLTELKDLGFERMIDLEAGFANLFSDDQYEKDCAIWGRFLSKAWFSKWSDFFPPSSGRISLVVLIMTYSTDKLYVHCLSGVDRTGVAAMAYRVRVQGWTFDEAHAEWVKLGRHWRFWWWKYFLKKSLK